MKNIVSRELSIHQEHELLLKLEQAGITNQLAQGIIESKGNKIAKDFIKSLNKNILTFQIEPLSLFQLREKYGTGEKGFRKQYWWLKEDFAKDVPEAGTYEINIEHQLTRMTCDQQKEKLPKNWIFPHPAVIAQAILKHYEQTGERLLDRYTRTSLTFSNGNHVFVGNFASGGLFISYGRWGSGGNSFLGVVPSRKSNKS